MGAEETGPGRAAGAVGAGDRGRGAARARGGRDDGLAGLSGGAVGTGRLEALLDRDGARWHQKERQIAALWNEAGTAIRV